MQNYLSDLYKKLSGQMKLGRQRAERMMQELGHPERSFPSIHVAGTNGKGTFTAIATVLLQQCGYKTGRFTSPHLLRFNERIQVDGDEIKDGYIKDFLEKNQTLIGESEASFFEVTTALGFSYFRDQAVDVAVVETGLGGRLDATSVLTPELSVITMIGYDHVSILGDTLSKIAEEKAGIIKEGKPVLTLPQDEDILQVFRSHSSLLHIVDSQKLFSNIKLSEQGMSFDYLPLGTNLVFPLQGEHLLGNLALAIKAVERFIRRQLTSDELQKAFDTLKWKGRFEYLSYKPPVIYDVAHNFQGIAALCKTALQIYPDRNFRVVLGLLDDKSPEKVMQELSALNGEIILAPVNSHRSMRPEKLQTIAKKYSRVQVAGTVTQACEQAYAGLDNKSILLILGSHYIAAEVYQFQQEQM